MRNLRSERWLAFVISSNHLDDLPPGTNVARTVAYLVILVSVDLYTGSGLFTGIDCLGMP